MLIFSAVNIFGLDNAVRDSKFPMAVDIDKLDSEIVGRTVALGTSPVGSAHDQFLTGIIAQFDLTFTVKAWWRRKDIIFSIS